MSEQNFADFCRQINFYLEDGDSQSLLANHERIILEAKNRLLQEDDRDAHYLLSVAYFQSGDHALALESSLNAARLGHCSAAMDFLSKGDGSSVEILGIAKAMNAAGHDLCSAQEDVQYYLEQCSAEEIIQANKIMARVTSNMKERGLDFVW